MPPIEWITADAREVLRRSIILPEAFSSGCGEKREKRRTRDSSKDVGILLRTDPAEVLDSRFGRISQFRVKFENRRSTRPDIEESDSSVTITGSEDERR